MCPYMNVTSITGTQSDARPFLCGNVSQESCSWLTVADNPDEPFVINVYEALLSMVTEVWPPAPGLPPV